jgi:hypothetical protein
VEADRSADAVRVFEALVAGIVADYAAEHDSARQAGWIAEVDGERAGCIFCVAGDEPGVAKLARHYPVGHVPAASRSTGAEGASTGSP